MVLILRVYVERIDGREPVTCLFIDVGIGLAEAPVGAVEHLNGAWQLCPDGTRSRVKLAVKKAHKAEIVYLRAARRERFGLCQQVSIYCLALRSILPHPAPVVFVQQIAAQLGAV